MAKNKVYTNYISPCPNKEECGSCPLSYLPYEQQCNRKVKELKEDFLVFGIKAPFSFVSSPKSSHYRNRMDYAISFKGDVGLRARKKWWRILDGHTCFIAHEDIELAFKISREWVKNTKLSYFDRKKHIGLLRYIVIKTTTTGELLISVVMSSLDFDSEITEIKILSELKELVNMLSKHFHKDKLSVVWLENNTITDVSFGSVKRIVHGVGYITETINNIFFKITPNSFFQNNLYLTPKLQEYVGEKVLEVLSSKDKSREALQSIFVLYSGSGFFSLYIAKYLKNVPIIAIEENSEAIKIAEQNKRLNSIKNIEFFADKVENKLLEYKAKLYNNIVILDPPRSGLHPKVISLLLSQPPVDIIYVSCKYKQFLKEYKELGLSSKYDIVDIKAFDMFPQTDHVEVVFHLKLRATVFKT